MKQLLFFLSCSFVLICQGQHSTLTFTNDVVNLNQQSILMIPLESKMYTSDINRKLAEANELTSEEIVNRFISGIDQAILYSFESRSNVQSFSNFTDEESKGDHSYIKQNVNYEYELVSKTQEKKKIDALASKFKKKTKSEYNRGGIVGGQIVTPRDVRERYMKAVISDSTVLDSIQQKFDNRFFLFVNQLDIRNNYGATQNMQMMDYSREIKLHYTLYGEDGQIILTGLSKTAFPSTENDIDEIIKGYFPILAENIFLGLYKDEVPKE